ncbi:hypothetical protein ACSBR2_027887 [Camellia fascicularis]
MARYFDVVGGGARTAGEEGLVINGSGFMIYVCMIVMSGSIMSMIIFACGKRNSDRDNKKQKRKRDAPDFGDCHCGSSCFCFGGNSDGGDDGGHGHNC